MADNSHAYVGEGLVLWIEEQFTAPCMEIFPLGQIGHGFCNFVPAFIVFPCIIGPIALLAWWEQRNKRKAKEAAATKKDE